MYDDADIKTSKFMISEIKSHLNGLRTSARQQLAYSLSVRARKRLCKPDFQDGESEEYDDADDREDWDIDEAAVMDFFDRANKDDVAEEEIIDYYDPDTLEAEITRLRKDRLVEAEIDRLRKARLAEAKDEAAEVKAACKRLKRR